MTALPPAAVQQEIGAAVHAAVVADYGPARAVVGCRAYARIGAAILSRRLGGDVTVVGGRLAVRGAGFWLRCDHAWIEHQGEDQHVLIDFSARNWPALAARAPVPLTGYPPVIWCDVQQIPAGIIYTTEAVG